MRAHEFKQIFLETWQEWTNDLQDRARAIAAWQTDRTWTTFMLGPAGAEEPNGFLHAVGAGLNRSVWREYYTLDCVYYRDEPDLVDGGGYPAGFDAIIEHENGDRPEEEWWKLLMWRAPLKVLICYDFGDDQKTGNISRMNWLVGKLEKFAEMTRQMDYRWPGRKDDDEYLIVVGYRPAGEELPRWRWM